MADKRDGHSHEVGSELSRQLELDLQSTRDQLRSTLEQLQCSNEELQASNEERQSMNEELRSTSEELAVSKESLRRLNDELVRVNGQVEKKIQAVEQANDDTLNLFNNTGVATLFLDTEFRVKRFTPAAARLLNLTAADIRRPLLQMTGSIFDDEVVRDAQSLLSDLRFRDREVQSSTGRWLLRRIAPYRTFDGRIGGVVITYVDVTDARLAADAKQRLAAIVESSADAIFNEDLDGTIRTWNRGAERLYGYAADEIIGRSIRLLVPDNRREELAGILSRLALGEPIEHLETERIHKDGKRVSVSLTISPMRNEQGKVVAASVIARDISERLRAETQVRDREGLLHAILNTAADAIITIDEDGTVYAVNPATERLFGYAEGEIVGRNVSILMPSPYREKHDEYLRRYRETGQARVIGVGREVVARRKDGSVFAADVAVSRVEPLPLLTGIIRDISRRKELEREVVEIASLQQNRIGQDLHDRVGQELTALNLMAGDLAELVQSDPEEAGQLVQRMALGLRRSQQELRDALRGLMLTSIESQGLTMALQELARRIQDAGKQACTFTCPQPILVADDVTATHLYLIAQEAVRNAVKHSQAQNIGISLEQTEAGLTLSVNDDGVGMPTSPTEQGGLGLRIMQNRAAVLGARFSIERVQPRGTQVKCTWLGANRV